MGLGIDFGLDGSHICSSWQKHLTRDLLVPAVLVDIELLAVRLCGKFHEMGLHFSEHIKKRSLRVQFILQEVKKKEDKSFYLIQVFLRL